MSFDFLRHVAQCSRSLEENDQNFMSFSFSRFVPSLIIMYVQRQTHWKAVALIPYLSEIKWNTNKSSNY